MAIPEKDILKYALQNAVSFNGKADKNAVLGKILKEKPELKQDIKGAISHISKIVSEVNKLPIGEQEKLLEKIAPELMERKKAQRRELPPLKNAEQGKVVTRLPPEPSKYLHIGHALSFMINYLYAKKYGGKCILRFEDTNPSTAKKEYIESMKHEIKNTLKISPDQTIIVSNDLPIMYKYAEKLISMEKAYACSCNKERIRELRHSGDICGCRTKSTQQNMEEWKAMLAGKHGEGERVLRLIGDMQSPNHVMRDPIIFRITYEEHYLQKKKYCVWPLYDFENAIEDGTRGVTHILRSSEFGQMRVELQDNIKRMLGLPLQTIVQYGRFNVIGTTTKGREIRELMKSGEYIGWDDPRLATLKSLTKRCIQPQTYEQLAVEVGLSASQTNIDFSMIATMNRKILDPVSKRYFFIKEPHKIKVEGGEGHSAEIPFHPTENMGSRKYEVKEEFLIEKKDFEDTKEGEIVRLMDCLNFKKKEGKLLFHSLSYEEFRDKGKKVIQWLTPENSTNAVVMMPDAKKSTGLIEKEALKIKENEIVQLIRFGFCRLEDKDKMLFWYGHG